MAEKRQRSGTFAIAVRTSTRLTPVTWIYIDLPQRERFEGIYYCLLVVCRQRRENWHAVSNERRPPRFRPRNLPDHAQDIYREAFNHAYAAHAGDVRRCGAPGAPGAQPRVGRIVQSRRFPPPWYVAEGAPLALSFSEVGPVLAEKLFANRGASSGLKVSIRDQ
jgi:hypothetical protein